VTKVAAKDRITLIRTLPSGEKKEISGIDLDSLAKGDPKTDLKLQPQDVVVVPSDRGKVVGYGFLDFLKGIFSVGIPIVPWGAREGRRTRASRGGRGAGAVGPFGRGPGTGRLRRRRVDAERASSPAAAHVGRGGAPAMAHRRLHPP